MKFMKEIVAFLQRGDYQETDEGLLIHSSLIARGKYTHSVNGGDERIDYNLIPAEGIAYMLDAGLNGGTPITNWYLGLFSGAVDPASNWTAANFASLATEITSTSEGYTEVTRQAWTPAAPAGGVISNTGTKAQFTIAATTSINVSGAALLSDSARGGTTGTLVSASRFASARTLYDADVFELAYEVELQDS